MILEFKSGIAARADYMLVRNIIELQLVVSMPFGKVELTQ
jgi:hypothetical protein